MCDDREGTELWAGVMKAPGLARVKQEPDPEGSKEPPYDAR